VLCGIPHLAKNERVAPNFLYAALDKIACAPYFKERRMKLEEPTKPRRKSGMWPTRRSSVGVEILNRIYRQRKNSCSDQGTTLQAAEKLMLCIRARL
jgi:hypothetical protein